MATDSSQEKSESLVPATWPGAFSIYDYSKRAVMRNALLLLEIVVIFGLLIGILSNSKMHFTLRIVGNILGALAAVMLTRVYLAGIRGKQTNTSEVFADDLPLMTLKVFGLNILVGFSLVISLLLFIVPFFFVLPRLTLANYFLIDKNMGIVEAYKASWAATKGNSGKVWGIIGFNLLLVLLACTIIGLPFALYFFFMYGAANAVLYEYLLKHQPAA